MSLCKCDYATSAKYFLFNSLSMSAWLMFILLSTCWRPVHVRCPFGVFWTTSFNDVAIANIFYPIFLRLFAACVADLSHVAVLVSPPFILIFPEFHSANNSSNNSKFNEIYSMEIIHCFLVLMWSWKSPTLTHCASYMHRTYITDIHSLPTVVVGPTSWLFPMTRSFIDFGTGRVT